MLILELRGGTASFLVHGSPKPGLSLLHNGFRLPSSRAAALIFQIRAVSNRHWTLRAMTTIFLPCSDTNRQSHPTPRPFAPGEGESHGHWRWSVHRHGWNASGFTRVQFCIVFIVLGNCVCLVGILVCFTFGGGIYQGWDNTSSERGQVGRVFWVLGPRIWNTSVWARTGRLSFSHLLACRKATAEDPGGISYFGYAYYSIFAGELSTVRIASDRFLGVQETADAKVEPSTYTITDGSYSVFKRKLYVNVDNTAWDSVHPFLAFGFSAPGQALVSSVGYIRTNVARLAKMRARVAERGNDEADYVSIEPDTCPLGTELSAVPYVNQFGSPKTSYNCTLCPLGKFKFLDTPTPCTSCEGGKYTDVVGQTACQRCQVGFEAVDGLFCRACQPGFYKKETAAASCSPCSAGSFSNQSAQSDCLYCPPGHFSLQGSTTCAPCPINEMASFPGTTQCAQCGEGFFATQEASTSCSRCGSGRYRSNESACLQCPGRMTTQYLAATTISDCVCPEGTVFNGDGRPGAGACEECMEGLDCILGSDLRNYESFLVGSDKELTFPRLIPGYISYPSEPTQVYKCGKSSHCPGGVPGTCARGRIGLACARCQAGQKFGVDHCKDRPCLCPLGEEIVCFEGNHLFAQRTLTRIASPSTCYPLLHPALSRAVRFPCSTTS